MGGEGRYPRRVEKKNLAGDYFESYRLLEKEGGSGLNSTRGKSSRSKPLEGKTVERKRGFARGFASLK